jgi:tetratricopeptide (TPR) repeat protein
MEKKLKICVYAISKNEESFVERFAASAMEADYVLIADTGSTDNTVSAAKAAGVDVYSICISPFRFDLARNAALALVPSDVDVCISLDLDEVLEPGWREEIERVWKDDTTRLRYFFDWGCGIKFKYEKIHHRKGYMWHHPVHEYPIPDPRTTEVWADTDMLLVSHHPDPTKSRGQYLDLLAMSVKEDPRCPRNAFYYARELSFYGRWQDAIDALNKYLGMPEATWANERCYAMRVMGKCYSELGNMWEAEKWYRMASGEAPNTREPWCELAMLMYRQGRWPDCYAAAMRALEIKDKALVYTADPEVWGHMPHDLASIAAWHMGLKDVSVEQAKLAVQCSPDDLRLRSNLRFVMELDKEEEAA